MTVLRGTVAWLAEYQRKQAERTRTRAPPKRLKLARPAPKETDVLTTVRQALVFDKRVAWVGRFNSGIMWPETPTGKRRPVRFHDVPGLSDLIGQLTDGRFLALEIKRPGWTKPTDERERQQAAFIELVLRHGGVAGFVRSIEDVRSLLQEAS